MRRFEARYTRTAARAIRRLPSDLQTLCAAAIARLVEAPDCGKRLHGVLAGYRSYRTGAYRIVYRVERDYLVIVVVAVGHLRDIYERLRRRMG